MNHSTLHRPSGRDDRDPTGCPPFTATAHRNGKSPRSSRPWPCTTAASRPRPSPTSSGGPGDRSSVARLTRAEPCGQAVHTGSPWQHPFWMGPPPGPTPRPESTASPHPPFLVPVRPRSTAFWAVRPLATGRWRATRYLSGEVAPDGGVSPPPDRKTLAGSPDPLFGLAGPWIGRGPDSGRAPPRRRGAPRRTVSWHPKRILPIPMTCTPCSSGNWRPAPTAAPL